ncbi:sulfite exporter TauE/SafE family protein [Lentibacillus sp. N15]|uniref:sulfite exporter TauE/SafE family protein n=1 Tax=Lentibacillus songyuanensis TaxID=3136161 RepID=UPI0031BB6D1C
MDIATALLLLVIGIIAGGYGTIVGAGGGFIFVPALLLILKMDPAIAAGSGLVIVLINSFSGAIGYARQKKIDYRTGILIAIGALPGSLLGVWLLHVYASNYFNIAFATVLMLLGLFLFTKNTSFGKTKASVQNHPQQHEARQQMGATGSEVSQLATITNQQSDGNRIDVKLLLPLGLLMGVLSSYLGIGGGWLLVPILIYGFKIPTHFATATSLFSLCIYSSYGVISQIFYNSIDWMTVLWGGIGIIIGSQLGVRLAQRIPGKIVMQMLSVLLVIIGFRMYFG